MKITKRMCVAVLTLFPLMGVAANGSLMGNAATPVQSYQSVDSPPSSQALSNKKNTPAQKKGDAVAGSASLSASAKGVDREAAQMLQAELTQINQNTLLFQQKVDDRLLELNNKYQLLQQQFKQLTAALSLLNQELVQSRQMGRAGAKAVLPQSDLKLTPNTPGTWLQSLKNRLGPTGLKVLIAGGAMIFVLLVWAVWPRRKEKLKKQEAITSPEVGDVFDDDTQNEYDYMGSSESIPAKLDLARTYIAMEDYVAARIALEEVSEGGSEAQKKEAADMLAQCPPPEA